jgi:carbonic anhydrase
MQVAILTCMDARIDVYRILGLDPGQAHVLRNAGGLITEDVVRTLAISQRKLGTREVLLMQHTKCGLIGFDDAAFRAELEAETGTRASWSSHGLSGQEDDLREAVRELRENPMLLHRDQIRAAIYDVESGAVREVAVD